MIKCKEFKGTGQNPDIDEAVNKFFEECDDTVDILGVNYSTAAVPFKTSSGAVSYQVISTCLLFLNYADEEYEDEQ